jgi:hypothetical protein
MANKCDRTVLVLREYVVDSADVSRRVDDEGEIYWRYERVIVYDSSREYLNGRRGSSQCVIAGKFWRLNPEDHLPSCKIFGAFR